ncbi:hypothetical protein [Nonomuraea sp. NPDC050786]|uniref:hypothetical protein n=1 Tax=Nonomuraea sp. NPDC050786 TaxID=3154840 RepID=UPI003400F552
MALAEPPVPTPLHKMAAFRRAIKRIERISISSRMAISKRRFCRALQQLAERYALANNIGRAAYYFSLANTVNRQGTEQGDIPSWVLRDVDGFLNDSRANKSRPVLRARGKSAIPTPAGHHTHTTNRERPERSRAIVTPRQVPPPARDVLIVDNSDRPRLGDPGHWADAIPLNETLVDFLDRFGWDARIDPLRLRWLRISCMHVSYIYEQEHSLSIGINARLLKAFEEVGKRWLNVALLDCYLADRQPQTRGEQSAALNSLKPAADKIIDGLFLPLKATLLGKGESAISEAQSSRSKSMVVRQIIGIIALMDGV